MVAAPQALKLLGETDVRHRRTSCITRMRFYDAYYSDNYFKHDLS